MTQKFPDSTKPGEHQLARVDVTAAPDLTAAYPERTSARVHVFLHDGREFHREQSDFEGSPTQPMSCERVVEKFHWLGEPFAEAAVRAEIIAAVEHLTKDLFDQQCPPVWPAVAVCRVAHRFGQQHLQVITYTSHEGTLLSQSCSNIYSIMDRRRHLTER
ncbi:hypothetical protein ABIA39_007049 [Nocardia sp. GAS34]|uniref:hypothetical protein n=1 Tax=unclassified Nocardia TaxID=2637762 RepID=UPI003D1F62A6